MRLILILTITFPLFAQSPSAFETHLTAAQTALQQSRYSEADSQLHAAVAELAKPDPARSPARIMDAYGSLCDLDLLMGRIDEAVAMGTKAVETAESAFGTSSPDLSPHLSRLAGALRVAAKTPEAVDVLQRMLKIDQTLGPDDPKVSVDYDKLGSAYLELRQVEDARTSYRYALETRISHLGPDHIDVATSWVNLGVLEERNTRPMEAKTDFETALAISEKKLGTEAYGLTGILDRLGALYSEQKWPNARAMTQAYFQRSLAIREKVLGPRHADLAQPLENLGWAYFFDSKFLEAEPLFQRSLQIQMATKDPMSPLIAQALDNIGTVYSAQKRYSEAEPYFKKALLLRETKDIESLTSLAQLYATTGDFKRSDDYYQRAVLVAEKGLGGDHVELADTLDSYAAMLHAANRLADAKKVEAHSKEVRDHMAPTAGAGTVVADAGPAGATGATGPLGVTGKAARKRQP